MARRRKKTKGRTKRAPKFERKEIRLAELKAILERAKVGALGTEDHQKLEAAVDTLAFLTNELEAKGASIRRLRKLIFGASTEKTSQVFGDTPSGDAGDAGDAAGAADGAGDDTSEKNDGTGEDTEKTGKKPKKKPKGHGRNGASAYRGAEKVNVPHGSLTHGEHCPGCLKGKVYRQRDPAVLVRVRGMAPLAATVYERERLRCNLCGEVFTADSPEGVGEEKYDETAASMIALLKYGTGLPFYRLERLEGSLGIPLPSSTQWDVVERTAGLLQPAYSELVRQAAQGEIVHNDDTTMKILELDVHAEQGTRSDEDADERTGVRTSGIVSVGSGHQIALFFTGRQHAGENLADVLAHRAAELGPPIQMCDALSHNTAGEFESILANCLSHSRRKFVDVVDNFPDETRIVLETLRGVYRYDAEAKEQEMSHEQRLLFHQDNSGPLMLELETWMQQQLDEKRVEPNSELGKAIRYTQKHWEKLTLFLRVPGAPLDNNLCERVLKKAILHRKNAYFYKTVNGARVGDLFMSLIHTAELCRANTFDYLVALQRHQEVIAEEPGEWMPWNFQEALARLTPGPAPPT